jgi:hypothetical protein
MIPRAVEKACTGMGGQLSIRPSALVLAWANYVVLFSIVNRRASHDR